MKKESFLLRVSGVLLFCMALLVAPALSASTKTDTRESGMTAGVAIGIGKQDHRDGVGFIIRPSLGYRINSDLELGGFFRYEHLAPSLNNYTLSAYSEYDFCHFQNNTLELFVDIVAGAIFTYDGRDYDRWMNKEPHEWSAEIGFVPGVKYHLPGTNVSLKLRYLFVGFNSMDSYYKDRSACIGGGNWNIDAALRRLELGVSVNF